MTKPPFRLVYGGGDIVEALEDALQKAKAGEFDAVVIVGITKTGFCGSHWAHVDDMAHPWARMLSAVASTQHELLANGLETG